MKPALILAILLVTSSPAVAADSKPQPKPSLPATAAPGRTVPATRAAEEPEIFDKAEWHAEGEYPEGLSKDNANNHIGFYLAWLIDRDLISSDFEKENASELKKYRAKELSGPKLLAVFDGVLAGDMLNESGRSFTKYYYDSSYLTDYEATLGKSVDSLYEVKDTPENYTAIKAVIDAAYQQWKAGAKK